MTRPRSSAAAQAARYSAPRGAKWVRSIPKAMRARAAANLQAKGKGSPIAKTTRPGGITRNPLPPNRQLPGRPQQPARPTRPGQALPRRPAAPLRRGALVRGMMGYGEPAGLIYDPSSGLYWDQFSGLYYDPYSGTYFDPMSGYTYDAGGGAFDPYTGYPYAPAGYGSMNVPPPAPGYPQQPAPYAPAGYGSMNVPPPAPGYPQQPAPYAPYPQQPAPYPQQPAPYAPYPQQPAPYAPYPQQPAPYAPYPQQPAPYAPAQPGSFADMLQPVQPTAPVQDYGSVPMPPGGFAMDPPPGFVWYGCDIEAAEIDPTCGDFYSNFQKYFPAGMFWTPENPTNVWNGQFWPQGDPAVGEPVEGVPGTIFEGFAYYWYWDGSRSGRWLAPAAKANLYMAGAADPSGEEVRSLVRRAKDGEDVARQRIARILRQARDGNEEAGALLLRIQSAQLALNDGSRDGVTMFGEAPSREVRYVDGWGC